MTFDQLLKDRRSVRKFQNKPVSVEMIHELIRESTLAPNAGNEQPWKYVIVQNKEMMQKISMESKQNILARIAANPEDYAKKYEKMLENQAFNIFYDAPCLILILGLSTLKNLYVDCALAASYLMLAAAVRGLGTCWINFATEIHDPDLKNQMGIPHNCTIVAPIILGYPELIPPVPKRKQPEVLKIIA